ncbi:aminopeptidase [Edwardsiella ictaluri]|uniref:Peptidase, M28 family n=1 Tax=Edwardsiella ictaluri (strain 93-146) TaxID=634503 RepID=C5BH83_EDWI9|nr:aminopeptidase [Edwardsiella ictaluri]ACR68019.1 peptidase, M28 family [Edwardsiella ictaluri 93-146]AVZ81569.1 aminopeptidase [Edwardsiella ictaluri]EKS7762098.1 aminopeptidase [Edwardsiella ictaluri]EKS7768908.1 aminopeptidase [Edwardsiella ictaluri]EKS7771938.1 aminopeptidase [Edwardsiella ictaluri]
MLSRCRYSLSLAALCLGCALATPVSAQTHQPIGKIADQEVRHIATYFPGRMAGSPAELMMADYVNQRFRQMGYDSNLRDFKTRYLYRDSNGKNSWHNVTATSVIAAKVGHSAKQILIVAHLDTFTPQSDDDVNHNLGGLTLQGVDDNASGVGVMLELAERLRTVKTQVGIRFLALSAQELGGKGIENYLSRMTPEEKKNTLLVIGIDSLISGDKLLATSNAQALAERSRDRLLQLAKRDGIHIARGNSAMLDQSPPQNEGMALFSQAGLPLLLLSAADSQDPTRQTRHGGSLFAQGTSWHQPQYDNMKYLDRHLPGRIRARTREGVRILLPLLEQLAR